MAFDRREYIMEQITVRFDQPVRAMKPVHGVNNGPKTRLFSLDMRYCGLFDYEQARKPFYALAAFNSLFRLQTQVVSSCDQAGIWTCAAANEEEGALLIVNTKDEAVQLLLNLYGFADRYQADVHILDEAGDLDLRKGEFFSSAASQLVVMMEKHTIVLIKLKNET
jgi:hypothetical protein